MHAFFCQAICYPSVFDQRPACKRMPGGTMGDRESQGVVRIPAPSYSVLPVPQQLMLLLSGWAWLVVQDLSLV